jgi:hypothetical protein
MNPLLPAKNRKLPPDVPAARYQEPDPFAHRFYDAGRPGFVPGVPT